MKHLHLRFEDGKENILNGSVSAGPNPLAFGVILKNLEFKFASGLEIQTLAKEMTPKPESVFRNLSFDALKVYFAHSSEMIIPETLWQEASHDAKGIYSVLTSEDILILLHKYRRERSE